jgi:hypothetical protein
MGLIVVSLFVGCGEYVEKQESNRSFMSDMLNPVLVTVLEKRGNEYNTDDGSVYFIYYCNPGQLLVSKIDEIYFAPFNDKGELFFNYGNPADYKKMITIIRKTDKNDNTMFEIWKNGVSKLYTLCADNTSYKDANLNIILSSGEKIKFRKNHWIKNRFDTLKFDEKGVGVIEFSSGKKIFVIKSKYGGKILYDLYETI